MNTYASENEFGKGEVHSWASILDDNCLEQAKAISRVPVVDGPVVLMPDAHFGYGPPVGSAIITKGAVMPYAVGVDIGCGMIACKTTLYRDQLHGFELRIMEGIRDSIPSGNAYFEKPTEAAQEWFDANLAPLGARFTKLGEDGFIERAMRQFGTLGGGNHFVEVSQDGDGDIWLVLHSGSRGSGKLLADMHVAVAQEICAARGVELESKEFAWLSLDSEAGIYYLEDMYWAQDYAYAQREAMMLALVNVVRDAVGNFDIALTVNCHHNYAEELTDGRVLTRKGAIDASVGRMGIIPGSMGDFTYIVEGKGCREAYNTAPHGAGRRLGRNAAKRGLDIDYFKGMMDGKVWQEKDAAALLDEAPKAYKPIATVIDDSKDLVSILSRLSSFINYKGVENRGRK